MRIKTVKLVKRARQPIMPEKTKTLIILASLFAAGLILGSGFLKGGGNASAAELCAEELTHLRSERSLMQTALSVFLIRSAIAAAAFVFGMSCVGLPVIMCFPLCVGLAYGALASVFISMLRLEGYFYYAFTLALGGSVFSCALMLCCMHAVKMSKDMLLLVCSAKQAQKSLLSSYAASYLPPLALILASSLLEGVSVLLFSPLFS